MFTRNFLFFPQRVRQYLYSRVHLYLLSVACVYHPHRRASCVVWDSEEGGGFGRERELDGEIYAEHEK